MSNTTPTNLGDVSEGDDGVAGKFFQIDVPDYQAPVTVNGVAVPRAGEHSYLRIGAAPSVEAEAAFTTEVGTAVDDGTSEIATPGDGADWGTDLALKAFTELDIGGQAGDDYVENSKKVLFNSSWRDDKTTGKAIAAAAFSRKIFTTGGWRDHSAGNRITTTRGDKVEVIGGNYKLVVLGHSLDSAGATAESAGFDISGGHVRGMSINEGEADVTEVRSVGGWKVTEKIKKGDRYEYYHGKNLHSYVGKAGSPDDCPDIVEKTWAKTTKGYTKATSITEETHADKITEETHADKISEETHAGTISEEIHATGGIDGKTFAGHFTEVLVAGAIASTTEAGAIAENVNAGAIGGLTVAGNITDITIAALAEEIDVIGVKLDATVAGAALDVFAGLNYDDIKLAVLVIEFLLGLKVSLSIGGVLELFAGVKVAVGVMNFDFSEKATKAFLNHTKMGKKIKEIATDVKLGICPPDEDAAK